MGDTAVTEKKRQRLVAVCGVKNSGKTTLLSRLVGELSKEGMKVAVIKHDGHDFTSTLAGRTVTGLRKPAPMERRFFQIFVFLSIRQASKRMRKT